MIFPIDPPPPQWWWRALGRHAGADPALLRPWDREQQSQIAVLCPSLADLPIVVDAINTCVAQANTYYREELEHLPGIHARRGALDRVRGSGQHQDAGGKITHMAPNTSSVIMSKSISKDGGRSSYRDHRSPRRASTARTRRRACR